MKTGLLQLADHAVQKFGGLNNVLEKVANALLPKTVVAAACPSTVFCSYTQGPSCSCGCNYSICRKLTGRKGLYWYATDGRSCSNGQCLGWSICEACVNSGYRCDRC
jgi:hypothetical protein